MIAQYSLLRLLQLVSAPVGSYSYSEGLEKLVDIGIIDCEDRLQNWLKHSLQYGAIRIEAALMLRGYRAAQVGNLEALNYWNAWTTATKETEELRQQSWQMGRTLGRLLQDVKVPSATASLPFGSELVKACGSQCNYAIAYSIAATCWQIEEEAALLGYLYGWTANLVNAGVKLIPLGQTAGQQLLLNLHPPIATAVQDVLGLTDDDLSSCSWGLTMASMAHETQYTRLFRS